MKIRHRQEILLPLRNPLFTAVVLAFWAVAVAARVVADSDMCTLVAYIYMASKCSSSAPFNGVQYPKAIGMRIELGYEWMFV